MQPQQPAATAYERVAPAGRAATVLGAAADRAATDAAAAADEQVLDVWTVFALFRLVTSSATSAAADVVVCYAKV